MARNEVLSKDFVFSNPEDSNSQVTGFTIEFKDSGNVIERQLSAYGANLLSHAAAHGFLQRLGDAAAGKQGEEAEEAVMGLLECLDADAWYVTREKGEARPSFIAQAVWQFKSETPNGIKEGETLETIVQRYAGKEGAKWRREALKVARVREIIEELKEQAEQERKARVREQIAKMKEKEAEPVEAAAL